jgi:diamine N-acetyltransferase
VPDRSSTVSLREVTEETVRDICKLSVRDTQQRFVAPNAISIAQAHFSDSAWFRGIYADNTPVGFVMLDDRPHESFCFLWRFMIDGRYQGCGFGDKALRLVIQHLRTRPAVVSLMTSVVQAEGGPQPFYENLGFVLTGDLVDGEAVMRLMLDKDATAIALPSELQPRLVPALLTHDMDATLSFYRRLGFAISGRFPCEGNATWAEVKRDSIRLQFHTEAPHGTPATPTCSGTFYLYANDLEALVREFEGKVRFAWGPEVMDYGQREFGIEDPNGYFLAFCEPALNAARESSP